MQRLHLVFPIVKLRPALDDPIPGRRQPTPPDPEIVDGEERWEVEKILNSRFRRNKLEYLVAWKGFGYDEKSLDAPDLIAEFYRRHPGAPRRIRTIQFGQLLFHAARADTSPRRGGNVKGTPIPKLVTSLQGPYHQLRSTPVNSGQLRRLGTPSGVHPLNSDGSHP